MLNCAFASAVDAVMAVYELIFEKKITDFEELKLALDNNWVGYEKLLFEAKRCEHKYGNGDTIADRYAEVLARYFAMKVGNRPNARGGVYKPIMHSAMQFAWQGEKNLATPDGRKIGEETSKNASPSIGADRNGATAFLSSAIKLRPSTYTESFCVDVMLHPKIYHYNIYHRDVFIFIIIETFLFFYKKILFIKSCKAFAFIKRIAVFRF